MKTLFIVVAVWLFVFFHNLFWYLKSRRFYKKFLSDAVMTPYKSEVKTLFSVAGTSKEVKRTRRTPYLSYVEKADISQLIDDSHFKKAVDQNFQETVGALRSRMINMLNPLYILFLFPSAVLQKLTKTEKTRTVWLNVVVSVVFWVASAVAGYILEKCLDKFFLERVVLFLPHWGGN